MYTEGRDLKKLSVAKFGGSLVNPEGQSIPKLVERISELKAQNGVGPVAVFSARWVTPTNSSR